MQLIRCAVALLILPFVLSSPQSTDPATNSTTPSTTSCVVNCPTKVDPCQCSENEVCVLLKRTCGQCAKNVCQASRNAASQAAKTEDTQGSSSQVSLVLIGVCGAGVVALLAGGLFVFYRRKRLSQAQGDRTAQNSLEVLPHHSGKPSMESTRDFIHPGAPWVRSVNAHDRSSVASSVATGWGVSSEMGDGRTTLMLARASTGLFSNPDQEMYKQSFDDSNEATNTLAELMMVKEEQLLLPAPAVRADDSMMDDFKGQLPNIPSVDSFARLSFSSSSFPIPHVPPPRGSPPQRVSPLARDSKSMDLRRDSTYRHSTSRSIGSLPVFSPMEAPRFPPPRAPPPRIPSTTSSIYFMDGKDGVSNARASHGVDLAEYKFPRLPSSAHHVGGTAGNRDSVNSMSSVSSSGSIAQVNIARVEPLRARTTIIQQKPVVGSLQDMQERTSRMLNGDDSRDRLSAVGSASFHRVAASMGGSSNHRKSSSSLASNNSATDQAYRKLVSQGSVKSEREKRRSSMVREAMKRASVEFVVRDGSLVRKSDEL